LDDHVENNAIKLRFAQLTIKALQASDESSRGIHFHLTDEMPYETFVRVMEIYMLESSIAFYGKDNNIWIFNYKPLPESELENGEIVSLRPSPLFCGSGLDMDPIKQEHEVYMFREAEAKFLLPLVLFLMLGFFSWKKTRRTTLLPNA
jgi:hypothetical protein